MRRVQKSVVCLLLAGFSAGASFALAPQDRTGHAGGHRVEAPAPIRLLTALGNLLARAWGRIGCEIDPAGRCQPGQQPGPTPPAGDAGTTGGDIGCQIDPYGGCAGSR